MTAIQSPTTWPGRWPGSRRCISLEVGADLAVERVNVPPDTLQLPAVVRLDRGVALLLELADLRLDRRLVGYNRLVLLLGLVAERLAERRKQMIFVHLHRALNGLVLRLLRDVTQLLHRLDLQFIVGVRHVADLFPPSPRPSSAHFASGSGRSWKCIT